MLVELYGWTPSIRVRHWNMANFGGKCDSVNFPFLYGNIGGK